MAGVSGLVAVVTGGGSGIGQAVARAMLAGGARVGVLDINPGEWDTSDALPVQADVTDQASLDAALDAVNERFGGVDILVNNAGILTPHTFPTTPAEDVERNVAVHLMGTFHVTRAAWPHLQRSDAARVVLTTSCALLGSPFLVAYGIAKGGLYGLGRNLAAVGAEDGIKVNLVAPYAKTRMADPDLDVNDGAREEVIEEGADDVFDRLLPENVSAVVGYLVHESCELTGEVLSAGGGRVARMLLSESQGWGGVDPTPDDVAANLDAIMDPTDAYTAHDITDYTTFFMERVPVPEHH
jgi:NAD(P)-dependent dehydrogenase (short-subunit alcohol dehydrogenase family)